MRKYYLLQLRKTLQLGKRRYKNKYIPNEEKETIGIYSSLKNAHNWIKMYGKNWTCGSKKEYFWTVMEMKVNREFCYNCDFYDLEGKHIKHF